MSTLPPRYVVCDNEQCVYVSLLRQVHPIRIGRDLFTYPPAYCGCSGAVELRVAVPNESGLSPEDVYELQRGLLPTIQAPFTTPDGGKFTVNL